MRNTFPTCGNIILLITPVATVKTGENYCLKKEKGIIRETLFSFHIPFPPLQASIAQYCTLWKKNVFDGIAALVILLLSNVELENVSTGNIEHAMLVQGWPGIETLDTGT